MAALFVTEGLPVVLWLVKVETNSNLHRDSRELENFVLVPSASTGNSASSHTATNVHKHLDSTTAYVVRAHWAADMPDLQVKGNRGVL